MANRPKLVQLGDLTLAHFDCRQAWIAGHGRAGRRLCVTEKSPDPGDAASAAIEFESGA